MVGLAFSGSLIANDNNATLSISEFKFPIDSALFCIPLDPPDEKWAYYELGESIDSAILRLL